VKVFPKADNQNGLLDVLIFRNLSGWEFAQMIRALLERGYDTVGGLVFFALGRVPVKGEVLHLSSRFKIEVIAADVRRIRRVRITRHP
jgi:CBS domain containing-hemolysin-like protein